MIEVTALSKSYKKEPVLKDVTFSVKKGTAACIIGQNGSGKSTLFSIIAGLIPQDSGKISFATMANGRPASLGYVPQDDYLFNDLTVKDNITFWAAASNYALQSPPVQESIALFDISPFWKKKISSLSGGMKKRVALCASLLHNPDILLLDEPFSGLDILHKEDICSYLTTLRKQGKTIVYSSHNADEIRLMATELFIIYDGSIYPVRLEENLFHINETVSHYLRGDFSYDKQ